MSLFDTTNATSTGVEPGEHVAVITEVKMKDAKSGKGKYINVKWQIDGGASFYAMYTTEHENKTAQNIGLSQIAEFQVAAGMGKGPVNDLNELVGLRCVLVTDIKVDSYGDKVIIKKYKKCEEELSF
jgi:hypothetical protein